MSVEFEMVCPVCQEHLTHATAINSKKPIIPEPGDVTVCAMCATLLEFDEEMRPHRGDINTLEPEVQAVVSDAIAFIRSRTKRGYLH
jgi:hypothetical protein